MATPQRQRRPDKPAARKRTATGFDYLTLAGPVTETPEDAGRAGEEDDGPGRGRQAGLAERGNRDRRSDPDHPKDDQSAESVNVQTEIVGFAWSAPLPAPADLGEYERIVPGSALRILAMTERTISGPIENTARLTAAEIEASKRGLSFAIRLTSAWLALLWCSSRLAWLESAT
jgi:uncharacterized membrane protein